LSFSVKSSRCPQDHPILGEKAAKQGVLGLVAFQAGGEPRREAFSRDRSGSFGWSLSARNPVKSSPIMAWVIRSFHQPVKGG